MMQYRYYLVLSLAVVCSSSFLQLENSDSAKRKIIIVLSNQTVYGQSDIPTANHFEETVVPYDEFTNAGYEVEFVSPNGGEVPLGYINTSFPIISRYIYDGSFMSKLKHTKGPEEIIASECDAIFFSGGGAAMFGVPENKAIQNIAVQIYETGEGIVSAICHGTAGLANIKLSDGSYLVSGKRVNGFPDAFENIKAAYYQEFPFSIQEKMKERGAIFTYSEEGWDEYLITDGRLITGQDPSSARKVAKAIIAQLQKNN